MNSKKDILAVIVASMLFASRGELAPAHAEDGPPLQLSALSKRGEMCTNLGELPNQILSALPAESSDEDPLTLDELKKEFPESKPEEIEKAIELLKTNDCIVVKMVANKPGYLGRILFHS